MTFVYPVYNKKKMLVVYCVKLISAVKCSLCKKKLYVVTFIFSDYDTLGLFFIDRVC